VEARLDRRQLRREVCAERLALGRAFGGRHVEELEVVVDVLAEAIERRELLFGVGALAEERLRLGLIVPETWGAGAIVELL
jgi:hypothetical protein